MHIIKLQNGNYLAYSPCARTEEAAALLRSIPGLAPGGGARVEHLVLPNLFPEHWVHAEGWAGEPALAGTTLWAVQDLLEGHWLPGLFGAADALPRLRAAFGAAGGTVRQLPLSGPLCEGLEGQVHVAVFTKKPAPAGGQSSGGGAGAGSASGGGGGGSGSDGMFSEAALLLGPPYRAVALADTAFGAWEQPIQGVVGAKLTGIYRRMGCPFVFPFMLADPRAGAAWARQVAAWDFDRVLGSHLDPLIVDAKREFERCFEFVLK